MLRCPHCTHNLIEVAIKGIKIQECENCKGKWFDRDELRLAKDKTDADLRWLDFDLFDSVRNKYRASMSQRRCPKDSAQLTSLEYMDSRIVIEKCDTCKGIWLDHDKFEEIIRYLENLVIAKPASEYAKDTLKEFSEILTGPENRISEIKDFFAVLWFFQVRLAAEHPWSIELVDKIRKSLPLR